MNSSPGAVFLRKNSKRFQFVNYDVHDIYSELMAFIDLVRLECNPDMRFVLTVSPVPLGVTFQTRDIVIENTNSKSILRVVADEIYRKLDYVDYFPSYEIVMNSPRASAWADDQLPCPVRHGSVCHENISRVVFCSRGGGSRWFLTILPAGVQGPKIAAAGFSPHRVEISSLRLLPIVDKGAAKSA